MSGGVGGAADSARGVGTGAADPPLRVWVEPGAVVYALPPSDGMTEWVIHGAGGVLASGRAAGIGRVEGLPTGHVVFAAGDESAAVTVPPHPDGVR